MLCLHIPDRDLHFHDVLHGGFLHLFDECGHGHTAAFVNVVSLDGIRGCVGEWHLASDGRLKVDVGDREPFSISVN